MDWHIFGFVHNNKDNAPTKTAAPPFVHLNGSGYDICDRLYWTEIFYFYSFNI